MIPIIRWELSRRRTYLLWWCIGVAALIGVLLAIYPSIREQAAQLDAVMKNLPESVRALRGGSADLGSPIGFLNAEVFYITLPLLLIIMSVTLGGSILARDEQDHTLELILARPVSRGRVLAAKALSAVLLLTMVGIAAAVVTAIGGRLIGMDISTTRLISTALLTTLFSASFGALTFSLSAASILSRKIGVTLAVVASFGGYLLESLSSLNDAIKDVAQVLPYHYFAPKDLLAGSISRGFVIYMVGIFVACAVISYIGFRWRDLS